MIHHMENENDNENRINNEVEKSFEVPVYLKDIFSA